MNRRGDLIEIGIALTEIRQWRRRAFEWDRCHQDEAWSNLAEGVEEFFVGRAKRLASFRECFHPAKLHKNDGCGRLANMIGERGKIVLPRLRKDRVSIPTEIAEAHRGMTNGKDRFQMTGMLRGCDIPPADKGDDIVFFE